MFTFISEQPAHVVEFQRLRFFLNLHHKVCSTTHVAFLSMQPHSYSHQQFVHKNEYIYLKGHFFSCSYPLIIWIKRSVFENSHFLQLIVSTIDQSIIFITSHIYVYDIGLAYRSKQYSTHLAYYEIFYIFNSQFS